MPDPILIDANSLAVRCIMAAAPEEVRLGLEFTGGAYGSLSTLRTILEHQDVDPGRVFACFDHSTPPRRKRLIPEYKEKRKKRNEDDLYPFDTEDQKAAAFEQVLHLRDLLQPLGVTTLCYREREADDILGALAQHFTAAGERPLIVSSDRDMWQMVGWGCRVWDLHSHTLIDAGNFVQHAGCSTDTYLLYKAIIGDSSDSIPGVHGLGPAKTSELFEKAHWDIRLCREPLDQLAALCDYVGRRKTRTKAQRQLLAERRRLEDVIRGIDLRTSFGPTDRLIEKLDERTKLDWMAFVRVSRRVGLRNLVGGHKRFVEAFRRTVRKKARRSGRKRRS